MVFIVALVVIAIVAYVIYIAAILFIAALSMAALWVVMAVWMISSGDPVGTVAGIVMLFVGVVLAYRLMGAKDEGMSPPEVRKQGDSNPFDRSTW